MKKLMFAVLAALTLSAGVAAANPLTHDRLPSPEYTYSTAGG